MDDEYAEEGHLFPRVFKDDSRIVGLTAQAVWSHDHRQIIHIHLSPTHVHRLSKDLGWEKDRALKYSLYNTAGLCWCCRALPVRSWWSSRARVCWALGGTEPHWWLHQDLHSDWCTAYRSSEESPAPPAPCTTTSTETLTQRKRQMLHRCAAWSSFITIQPYSHSHKDMHLIVYRPSNKQNMSLDANEKVIGLYVVLPLKPNEMVWRTILFHNYYRNNLQLAICN